jgi:hypothetical protein
VSWSHWHRSPAPWTCCVAMGAHPHQEVLRRLIHAPNKITYISRHLKMLTYASVRGWGVFL